jgi:hypothetical protein
VNEDGGRCPPYEDFTVSRDDGQGDDGGTYPGDVILYFTLMGNVVDGSDYMVNFPSSSGGITVNADGSVSGWVLIPAGQATATVEIDPLSDPSWTDDDQLSDDNGQAILAMALQNDAAENGGQPSYAILPADASIVLNPLSGA